MADVLSSSPLPLDKPAPAIQMPGQLSLEEVRSRVLAYQKGRRYFIAGGITGWILGMGLVFGVSHQLHLGALGITAIGLLTLAAQVWLVWYKDRYQGQLALEWAGPWCPSDRFNVTEVLAELDKAEQAKLDH